MRHRILTCKNHPELRWSTKDIAWEARGYNGMRSLFFEGISKGQMFSDGSGLDCTTVREDGSIVRECDCSVASLVLAPEDAQVVQ